MIASQLMRPCPQVLPSETVADIAKRLAEQAEWFFAVVDPSGRLRGIVTEFDLMNLIYQSGEYDASEAVVGRIPAYLGWTPDELRKLTAEEIMTNDPETVSPSATVDDLAVVLVRNRRKVVFVVEGPRLLGAVHRADLVSMVLG